MMKGSMLLTAALALALPAAAGEHPEHPKGHEHPGKEHADKHEHPGRGKKAAHKELMKEFVAAVEGDISAKAAGSGGKFMVSDEALKKDWGLKLLRIHKHKIARLSENSFFACADFKETEGKGKVDLDFYVSKSDAGWKVDKVLVHKVDGKPRFTYNEKNEIVPLEEKTSKEHEHPKGGEHPKEHPSH
jgi:hypothetical protein